MFFQKDWEIKWDDFSYKYAANNYSHYTHNFIQNFTQVSILLSNTAISYFINMALSYDYQLTQIDDKKLTVFLNKFKKKDFEEIIKLLISYYIIIFEIEQKHHDFLKKINLTFIELEHEMMQNLGFNEEEKIRHAEFKKKLHENYDEFRTWHSQLILRTLNIEDKIKQVPVVLTLDKAISDIYERLVSDLDKLAK